MTTEGSSDGPADEAYPVGPVIATGDTLMLGFGIEGIASESGRNGLVGRMMDYLLRGREGAGRIFLPLARNDGN